MTQSGRLQYTQLIRVLPSIYVHETWLGLTLITTVNVPHQPIQGQLRRRTRKVALWGIVLVLISAAGFNAAMLVFFVAVPMALHAFVSAARKWDGYTRASTRWRVGLMVIGAVLLVLAPVSISVQSRLLEVRLQPIIVALEAYRDVSGSYPGAIDVLVPEYMESIPNCPNLGVRYYPRDEDGTITFALTCTTFGFNKHTYFSATGLWKDWD